METSDADVVQSAVVPQGDGAGLVDAVASPPDGKRPNVGELIKEGRTMLDQGTVTAEMHPAVIEGVVRMFLGATL